MKILFPLLLLAMTGCQNPRRLVEGTFVINGEPKSGVEVRLPSDIDDFSKCGNAPVVAVTDKLGKFTASAARYPIRPCFTVDGKVYSDFFIVDDGKEDPIALNCRLPILYPTDFEGGHVCR